jgi:ABC-type nitrate/sulfonate/bicarbonate transport system permease component
VKNWRGLVVPLVLLLFAEAYFRLGGYRGESLAPPSAIIQGFTEVLNDGSMLRTTLETFATVLGGIAIGAACGVVFGCALSFWNLLYRFSYIVVECLRPIPSVALLPLSLMIFGFGYKMEIAIIAYATGWPFLILTYSAVVQIEPTLIEVARAMGFGPVATGWKIILPATAPRLMTALRFCIGIALVVAVTSEIVSNPLGLGHELIVSQETLRPARMLAYLALVGAIGGALNTGLLALQYWMFHDRGEFDTSVSV